MSESNATAPEASVPHQLVPPTTGEAKKINKVYAEIMSILMNLFNQVGPQLAKKHDLNKAAVQGVYLCAFEQMLCAVAGLQFGLGSQQQIDLADNVSLIIKNHAARAKLFLGAEPIGGPSILVPGVE